MRPRARERIVYVKKKYCSDVVFVLPPVHSDRATVKETNLGNALQKILSRQC